MALSSLEPGTIIDAGGSNLTGWMKERLQDALLWRNGPYKASGSPQRLLPSPLLSDRLGMELWDHINRLPDYYQTDAEVELLRRQGTELASRIQPHTIIVDLGCGDVRKVRPLLDTIEQMNRPVYYVALDLCRESLVRGMDQISGIYDHVKCIALWASFDSGLEYLNTLGVDNPRLFLSLGSIFGNDYFPQAVARLVSWKQAALQRPGDAMLLTMDGTFDQSDIWKSYHDDQGTFEKFIRNGYHHSNLVLGVEWYHDEDWQLDAVLRRDPTVHVFVLRALKHISCPEIGLEIAPGEQIDCYEAFKYGPGEMSQQFGEAGLCEKAHWKAPQAEIYQYLLMSSGLDEALKHA